MEKKKSSLIMAVVLLIITVCFTILVCVVDKQPASNGTEVGFATLNEGFKDALGEPGKFAELMDKLTDGVMVLAILAAFSFVVIGAIQLVRRKSLLKVDKAILVLAGIYVVMVVLYVLFDKVPINYRPYLAPGEIELEASFPSTHTLVICTVFGTALVAWGRVFSDKKKLVSILRIIAFVFMICGVAGRILAGVHWITDIVAGLLFSATLTVIYTAVLDRVE